MDRARTVFMAVGHPLNLARAYHVISWVHLDEDKLPDALDAIEEAWKYAELSSSQYTQMAISQTFGRILFKTDQDTKAWKHIEIALTNASYVGDRYNVARALEFMGYGYLRRGDYENAHGAYEASAEMNSGGSRSLNFELCKENMDRIKRKQENPDTIIGFYKPPDPGSTNKTLFYPPVQAFASEPPVSHS